MTNSSRTPRRRLPWKVDFAYPNGAKGRIPRGSYEEAELQAGAIAQRGGQITLSYLPPSDGPGPAPKPVVHLEVDGGNVHRLSWAGGDGPDGPWFACSCGRTTAEAEQIRWHLERFGICSFCIGERTVGGAAEGFLAGLDVDCPVCGGSGAVNDMDFHDLQRELYIPRLQALASGAPARAPQGNEDPQ